MKIKKRTLARVLFITIFIVIVAAIVIKYRSYERRILLFEMVREIAFLYALVVELPLAFVRNRDQLNELWKRIFLFPFLLFAVFFICVAGVDTYNLTKDVFTGYREKMVSVIKREHEYRMSDSVWVSDHSKLLKLHLALGYINVDVGQSYSMRIFENSRITIPINKVE